MLQHNDFLIRKLYINHKTRRKIKDSLKALPTFKRHQILNYKNNYTVAIYKHKQKLHSSFYCSKSFKLTSRKSLSNTFSNHFLQIQLLKYQCFPISFIITEKRLSLQNHEFSYRNMKYKQYFGNELKSNILKFRLPEYWTGNFRQECLTAFIQSTQNDLKQRLALRKRYLKRKRKRKYFPQQQQQFSNNYYCQQLLDYEQQQALFSSSSSRCLNRSHQLLLHQKYEIFNLTNQQYYYHCHHLEFQQQQSNESATLAIATATSTTESALSLSSQHYSLYQQRLHHSITMLQLFVITILRLSINSIAALCQTTATNLTGTMQHIVSAVVTVTTLPIIQQQQHSLFMLRDMQQFVATINIDKLPPANGSHEQQQQQQQLQQQDQLQQKAHNSHMFYRQQKYVQQHRLHEKLLLTAKGLNKYSWMMFLLIYLNLSAKVCFAGYNEKRLLHDLLDTYNTLERPVLNESDPLQLSFGLTLMQIIDVDEKNQLLVTNVWLKLEWNDMNLRWNTSDYGGIKDLRIPPHRIWKPDVLMYNSADEGFDGTYQTNVVVRNNGSCLYVPPGIFKSTCKIDITWFPFDDQRCEMKFGSWTYDGFQLDLQLQDETGGDISSYVLNGEWELLGVPGKRNEIYYNCCPEPYIDITFAIIIRRRTLYYFFNLIIPCVLIASMALLGFTLPPDSGEKLSLGVTILLSLTVFLNMVAETMPATSDAVPLLGTYFNCIMFMVASSVVSTILILNYHHRNADTHEMSEWIRVVFLCWLPWILRMNRPGRPIILDFSSTPCSDTSSERKHQIMSDVELKERSSKSLLANVLDIDDDFRNIRPMTPGGTLPHNPAFYRTVYGQGDDGSIGPIGSTRMPDAVTHHTCIKTQTEYELSLILKEIRFITDQLRKEDEENDIANDWKFAAMVVDRLCLIIFTMFAILATIAVLLSAPHVIVS